MYNVQTKYLAILAFIALIVVGCGDKEGKNDEPRQMTANEMLGRIEKMIEKGRYAEAIVMIDSLNKTYPNDVRARKTTLLSRARAMEGMYRDSIPRMEAIIALTQAQMDSLRSFFVQKDGFLVDRDLSGSIGSATNTFLPKLADENSPWTMTVVVEGRKGVNGLTLYAGGQSAKANVKDAETRRIVRDGKEMMTFNYKELNPLGEILPETPVKDATLSIDGSEGNVAIPLTPEMQRSIWRTFQYSYNNQLNRLAKANLDLYQRKLAIAQNQVANFRNGNMPVVADTTQYDQ